ncbi:MAG: hypothetical protein ABI637_09270 [Gemmatimonadota bacterium]
MRPMRPLAATALAAIAVACGDPNQLADATVPNAEKVVTLYALTGTPIASPSAYSIADGFTVRTDQGVAFDFAFNIDETSKPVVLPLSVLGLGVTSGTNAGFLKADVAFDALAIAPLNGYVTSDTIHIAVGERYAVRSRVVCSTLGVPKYGKIEVTAIDLVARSITLRVVSDDNCGYRGLAPGLPTQ